MAASKLHELLRRNGYRVWDYRTEIIVGQEWPEEMVDAIVRSDLVIFLASRQSMASDPCRTEIVFARDHGRRVVVVRVDPDQPRDGLPEDFSHLESFQWIDLSDTPEFEARFLGAVSTDFDRLRRLKRLDIRATDWDRSLAGLLNGTEIRAAEKLVATPDEPLAVDEARPTPVMHAYVAASRRRRTRWLRIAVALAATVVLGIAASGVYAVQRDAEGDVAERAAVVQRLRSESDRVLEMNPAYALRLQLAAYSLDRSSTGHALLARTTFSTSLHRHLKQAGDKTRTLAYTADGVLVAGGFDEVVRTFPNGATSPVAQLPVGSMVDGVVTAPGSDVVVILTTDQRILVERVRPDGRLEQVSDSSVTDGLLSSLDASADGRLLASGSLTRTASLLSLSEAGEVRRVGELLPDKGVVTSVRFSDVGRLLAVADEGGVTVWDVTDPLDPVNRGRILLAEPASPSTAFSADGRRIAVGAAGRATVYDLADIDRGPIYSTPERSSAGDVGFAPGGSPMLATVAPDRSIQLWNTAAPTTTSPEVFRQEGVDTPVLAFSPDGSRLAAAGETGTLTEWWIAGRAAPRTVATGVSRSEISDIAASRGTRSVAVGSAGEAGARITQLPGGATTSTPDLGTTLGIGSVDIDDRSGAVALGQYSGYIQVTNRPGFDSPRGATLPDNYPAVGIQFSSDGSLLATENGEGPGFLFRLTPDALVPVGRLEAVEGPAEFVAIRPDGQQVAVGGRDGKTRIYRLEGGSLAVAAELPAATESPVYALDWYPDSRHLAVASETGIRIFEPTRSTEPLTSVSDQSAVASAIGTVAGRPVFSTWSSQALAVWDTSEPAAPVKVGQWAGDDSVYVSSFSPDGRWLAIATDVTWRLLDLSEGIETAADPVPAACTAASSTEIPPGELASSVNALQPIDPCVR